MQKPLTIKELNYIDRKNPIKKGGEKV